ncbi:pyrimidine reductase family protein [Agromyces sp. ISL-38]|uniref:pyrimidine reductase family protein n=1 Tax=Agromyces sp. ISL-38 TaxID=2819107 RepID=UPI001BEAD95F|nr:pyrimidine reductase family protein [Agromyces sp. ISL-38]MBT2498117.1 pyrimidine reductase family protein [Agromyces sp. ISL-38]MBT2518733.1 pyrimidine reductase family protein [Streptomyces sp. ISL-90]
MSDEEMTIDRASLLEAYALPEGAARHVRMNFVASLDGAVSIDGRSGGLGNEADRLAMQVMRTLADVVLVGAGTVRVEGYGGVRVGEADAAWRLEHGRAPQPRLAVVSSALDLDPHHPFFAKAVERPIVVTHAAAPAERRDALSAVADVLVCGGGDGGGAGDSAAGDGSVDLEAMLDSLAHMGIGRVLCEGGPRLFGALMNADLVDELCLSLSPLLVGGTAGRISRGAAEMERSMHLVHAIPAGDLLLLRYSRADRRQRSPAA